jgi:phosphatidate phosphatase APP1
MLNKTNAYNAVLQVYHGYGHSMNLTLLGNVYKGKPARERKYTKNIFSNIYRLIQLFFIKPVADARIVLQWQGIELETRTEKDGFFKFEWSSPIHLEAGWHDALVKLIGNDGIEIEAEKARVWVPHITQYAFVSDIDDTVMISHSATKFKRLRSLLTKHPYNRRIFEGTRELYEKLSTAYTEEDIPNPFFYVSSSEWNLYFDLQSFFSYNKLPQGIFLLSQMKRWFQLFKTGQTKHQGKLARIYRVMEAFPNQQFVLLGDNSQADPEIYAAIADKFPNRVFAIYIRNIRPSRYAASKKIMDGILAAKNIHRLVYHHSDEVLEHGKKVGLIE